MTQIIRYQEQVPDLKLIAYAGNITSARPIVAERLIDPPCTWKAKVEAIVVGLFFLGVIPAVLALVWR